MTETTTLPTKLLMWRLGPDTGSSSKTIWHVMTGIPFNEKNDHADIPWDPSDFGRCHRLLELAPEWKSQLYKLGNKYPRWRPLVENWDKMTELYLRDLPTGKSTELYELMGTLRGKK